FTPHSASNYQMKKITYLLILLFAGTVQAADKPNILVLLSDDLPWNMLGYQGGKVVATPNIDRIANNGAQLNQFYVQSVCSPTRASFMTGRYPFRNGTIARFNQSGGMLLDERTLANAIQEAGYWTAIVGKWHLGNWESEYLPRQRGFDHQYGSYGGVIDYYSRKRNRIYDWHRNDEPLREEGYTTELIGNEAVRLIENHSGEKPFFMYVPFTAVHSPHQAPEEVVAYYQNKYAEIERSENNLTKKKGEIAAMAHVMDQNIGRILDAIDERGWTENTLIVFFNDNGGSGYANANLPLRGTKASYWDGGIKVPFAAQWPGKIKAGTVVDEPVMVVDLYPTLIKLAGGSLEQPLPIDGFDIWPVIAEGAKSPREEFIWSPKVIRRNGWKLIDSGGQYYQHGAKGREELESGVPSGAQLYNIAEDPYEENNLINDHPEIVRSLRKRLSEIQREIRPAAPVERLPRDVKITGKEENSRFKGWGE
ncbi:MAG: arylsulfatase, partial [Opitutales bacterium]|nr:arylsulfatase [Opitutales bacterium]